MTRRLRHPLRFILIAIAVFSVLACMLQAALVNRIQETSPQGLVGVPQSIRLARRPPRGWATGRTTVHDVLAKQAAKKAATEKKGVKSKNVLVIKKMGIAMASTATAAKTPRHYLPSDASTESRNRTASWRHRQMQARVQRKIRMGAGKAAKPPPRPVDCAGFEHPFLRPAHGCLYKDRTSLMHCQFDDLRVDVDRIHSDRGGEPIEAVMGRAEENEFCDYDAGAFSVLRKPDLPSEAPKGVRNYYLQDVLNAMEYPNGTDAPRRSLDCNETWTGTTLLLTRYEYVNIYHTVTDWWNAYFSLPRPVVQPVRVIFLDAHAQGGLDDVWHHVVGTNSSGVSYVRHLPAGGVCLKRAIFVPPGYTSPLYPKSKQQCFDPNLSEEFADHMVRSYGLEHERMQRGKVVIIDRIPYISHPRSKPMAAQRIVSNMNDLRDRLLREPNVTSVEIAKLEIMPMREQMRTMRRAHVLVGNHGAGLTHMLWMQKRAHVVELGNGPAEFFSKLHEWRELASHDRLKMIFKSTLHENQIESIVSAVRNRLYFDNY